MLSDRLLPLAVTVLSTNVTIWRHPDGVCNFVLAGPAADPEPSRLEAGWRYRLWVLPKRAAGANQVLGSVGAEHAGVGVDA